MSPSRPPHALLLHHLRLVLCALLWLFASTASSAAPAPVDALPDQASAITPAAGEALGHRPWAMVLCKFADVPAEPAPLSYHQQLFAGPAPSIADYWREASYGQLDLTGSVVRGWYTLPRPRAAYLTEPPPLTANLALLKSDCLAAADADLFYPSFAGVAMVFNAETDGAARGGCGQRTTLDGVEQVYGFTYLPSAQPLSVGLTIHEMSHAFCLGHSGSSYDTVENGGGPIGSTASLTALTPSFSKHVHPNAYHKQVLGWLPDARVVTVPWGTERAVDIERLANPGPQGALLVRVEHATAAHQYLTLETRLSAGYEAFQDTNPYLDRAGVVMHAIDTTRANGYARSGTAMAVDT
ncbi:MAG: hypothetical protein RLZZ387_891, partial [Chloroflexota bacterium]